MKCCQTKSGTGKWDPELRALLVSLEVTKRLEWSNHFLAVGIANIVKGFKEHVFTTRACMVSQETNASFKAEPK